MMLPGLKYHHFDSIASITSSNKLINGSGIFFDKKMSYALWFRNKYFNKTLDLFGQRAYRNDDFDRLTNLNREICTCMATDYGVDNNYTVSSHKTNQWYNLYLPDSRNDTRIYLYDWYYLFQPHNSANEKFEYSVGIKYSNQTGQFANDLFDNFTIFGPAPVNRSDEKNLPVLFTEPYFDCNRSNRWIVTAVSPISELMPRYPYHKEYYVDLRYVAVATMDMQFLEIDFNPCPLSAGHKGPNLLANTARCKNSTICEPLSGWGFRRGGYHCTCKPGYKYPPWQNGPFLGIEIEKATGLEYDYGFDCIPIRLISVNKKKNTSETSKFDLRRKKKHAEVDEFSEQVFERPERARRCDRALQKVPKKLKESWILNKKLRLLRILNLREIQTQIGNETKKKFVSRISNSYHIQQTTNEKNLFSPRYRLDLIDVSRKKRQVFNERQYSEMADIMNFIKLVNAETCTDYYKEHLTLPGDVGYNVKVAFSNQAKIALRLSHFLSNFLQNLDKNYEFPTIRNDFLINEEQVFGEVLANVMSDSNIVGSGVFFDYYKFEKKDGITKQLFGPYAYRYYEINDDKHKLKVDSAKFRAIDQAGLAKPYLYESWFKNVKERWQSNTYGLQKFREEIMIRREYNRTKLVPLDLLPMYFEAPAEEDGLWSSPYFNCNGYINEWVITYAIPFFGLNFLKSAIEFKGVVTVDVKLNELDINQCPQGYFEPNAFKNTAKCDYATTDCFFVPGQKFNIGAYKCTCKVGYEYPFKDSRISFDGQTMEEEYMKKINGDKTTRFDILKCRISMALSIQIKFLVFVVLLSASLCNL